MANVLNFLTAVCILASVMDFSRPASSSDAIHCMSCLNDCDREQKKLDCSDSISRCLTVFLDKSMGEENLKYKGCAPPGSESLGCKETLNLGQFGDLLDKVFNKEGPKGYHCTCSGSYCNGSRSLTASLSAISLLLLAGFGSIVASFLGRH